VDVGFGSSRMHADGFPDLDAVTVHQQRRAFFSGGCKHCDWAQETDTVSVYVAVGGMRARELAVQFFPERLVVSKRGTAGGVLLAGTLGGKCDPSESEWEVAAGELQITLRKALRREWAVPFHPEEASAAADLPAAVATAPAPAGDGPRAASSVSAASSAAPTAAAHAPTRGAARAPPPPRATSSHAAAAPSKLSDEYRAWDRFDELAALTTLENGAAAGAQPAPVAPPEPELEPPSGLGDDDGGAQLRLAGWIASGRGQERRRAGVYDASGTGGRSDPMHRVRVCGQCVGGMWAVS